MRCWKCMNDGMKSKETVGTHHIRGNQFGDETIDLCKYHHDIVEAVCNRCARQKDCFESLFQVCWKFEDGIPPVNFKQKDVIDNIEVEGLELSCPKCDSKNIKRISYWERTILPLKAYWKCNKCKKISFLSINDWRVTDLPVDELKHIKNIDLSLK